VGAVLRIRRIELEDFGPFKGRQSLDFPDSAGIVVVYGENMRGKTTLLNAIRFALFGKVLGRSSRSAALHQLGNWEQAASGSYGFGIVLDFESDGTDYRLTRTCRPRKGVVPASDQDYEVEFFLEKDGAVLGPQQAGEELERIMPEQIARFFLFDGELLQEYEDLLRSESDMGRLISEAIERILGVPILTRSRATLAMLTETYSRKEAKDAQADQYTAEMGNQLAILHDTRKTQQDGLDTLRSDLDELRDAKTSFEEQMRRSERYAAVLDKRDTLLASIDDLDEEISRKKAGIAAASHDAWQPLVAPRAESLITSLRNEERNLMTAVSRLELAAGWRSGGLVDNTCPTCSQEIDELRLEQIFASEEADSGRLESLSQELRNVQGRIESLRGVVGAGTGRDLLEAHWSEMRGLQRRRFTLADEASELGRQLEAVDQVALRSAQADFEKTVKKIGLQESGIATAEAELAETDGNIERVRRKLSTMGSATGLEGTRARRELCEATHDLLDKAVQRYRAQLRERVQADATEIFAKLTTEPEYVGLRINDSYGLTIVHEDGSEIPVRSAGAEHIVALSLVAALQRNAPLRGPIFIDSPFGRLDRQHTSNVVSALPEITEQVCLLVYEEELRPQLARDLLRGKLQAEYELRRESARHTILQQFGGLDD